MQLFKSSLLSRKFIGIHFIYTRLHTPVMVDEVLKYLSPCENNVMIDMTFGSGGHTKALLDLVPSLKIICLDRDPSAYSKAIELSNKYPKRIIPCLGKFSELPNILKELHFNFDSIDGILFDFGCSSDQFETPERGFSINKDGPLDMRMDGNRFPDSPTAYDVLSFADEIDLIKIFKLYGEEKNAKKIARAIIEARYTFRKIRTTHDLTNLVENVSTSEYRLDKLQRPAHVSTKIFQALRIFVNNELNEINYAMLLANKYLKRNGRLVTISFHSLEDRIVKRHLTGIAIDNVATRLPLQYLNHHSYQDSNFMEKIKNKHWKQIVKQVILPTEEEIEQNPRSRSAKLRAAVKSC